MRRIGVAARAAHERMVARDPTISSIPRVTARSCVVNGRTDVGWDRMGLIAGMVFRMRLVREETAV